MSSTVLTTFKVAFIRTTIEFDMCTSVILREGGLLTRDLSRRKCLEDFKVGFMLHILRNFL